MVQVSNPAHPASALLTAWDGKPPRPDALASRPATKHVPRQVGLLPTETAYEAVGGGEDHAGGGIVKKAVVPEEDVVDRPIRLLGFFGCACSEAEEHRRRTGADLVASP